MNLIPVIREALGLQENEEFKIKVDDSLHMGCDYRFTNCQLQEKDGGCWECSSNVVLGMLVAGQCEIIKLPFKPKEGEDYYFIDVSTGYVCRTIYVIGYCRDTLRNCREMLRISSGNCYRTEEEAEKHVDEWMGKLYGKEWRKLYESDTND